MGKTELASPKPLKQEKHPHAYGEDLGTPPHTVRRGETSPRVWGRLYHKASERVPHRNIPTRMGKTKNTPYTDKQIKKHPHAYGEDVRYWRGRLPQRKHPHAYGEDSSIYRKNRYLSLTILFSSISCNPDIPVIRDTVEPDPFILYPGLSFVC